jgi:hypothetical protein
MKKKKEPPLLPVEAVKALLQQGLYLRDVSRVAGWTIQELSMASKIWGLPTRKRGPKPRRVASDG